MTSRERIAWLLLGGSLVANLELGALAWLRSSNAGALRQAVEEREELLALLHERWKQTTDEAGTLRDRLRQCQLYVVTRLSPAASAPSASPATSPERR
jgi:hypothetical protein